MLPSLSSAAWSRRVSSASTLAVMSIRTQIQSFPTRLREARRDAGLTQNDVAVALGVDPKAVSQWERDPKSGAKRKPTRPDIDKLPRIAGLYGRSIEWLLSGVEFEPPRAPNPVVGYVGAGAEIHPVDDHVKGQGIDEAPPFPGQDGPAVAVRVRGDSMLPQLEDGWLLYYARDHEGVPPACLGQLCVVQIHDGPTLVKKVEPGRKKGLYRLVSYNASTREDVRLDWAARVRAIVP